MPPASKLVLSLCLVVLLTIFTTACGKSPSKPSDVASQLPTFVGDVSLPGGATGTLLVRAMSALNASVPRVDLFARLLAWVEPAAFAQGSTATGVLATSDGFVIGLSGTYSGNTFNVSGGGFSLTATTSNGGISGGGTAPGGAATVTPTAPVTTTSPAPTDASGTYRTTYHMDAVARFKNTVITTGATIRDCNYNVSINGALTIELGRLSATLYDGFLISDWTETDGAPNTCPFVVYTTPDTPGPGGPGGTHSEVLVNNMVFGRSDTFNNNGTNVRTETFVGAVSGNTIVGRFSRSMRYTAVVANGQQDHASGFPPTTVNVTLTK